MSSTLIKYIQLKKQKEEINENLLKLENNPSFQKEKEFSVKLEELLKTYDKTATEAVRILMPDAELPIFQPRTRTPRARRRYLNPHTGEECVTAGGNHKKLKEWREKWPEQDFSEWLVVES